MKNPFTNFWITGILAAVMFSCNDQGNNVLSLKNELTIERPDEPVVISREQIVSLTGQLPTGEAPIISDESGATIPYQLDDLNGDGEWDELATTLSFDPQSERHIQVKLVPKEDVPDFIPATNIRFGVGDSKLNVEDVTSLERTTDPRLDSSLFYQMEGPAWENDKVGFRVYFDPRNGFDIFGKTVPDMVLDAVGLKGNYHELDDWGMDILKVGNSLGAGAVAIMLDDSLVRLGQTALSRFERVVEGPARAIFRLGFEGWQVGDQNLSVNMQITIWKGKYWYENTMKVSGFNGSRELVTGIVNLYADDFVEEKSDQYVLLSTFDKQSENKDLLGMGLILDAENFGGSGTTAEEGEGITQTFYTKIKALSDTPVKYYFAAGWEKSGEDFKSAEAFRALLEEDAERLFNPIVISAAGS